jgi:hypothetical protein
VTLYSEERKKSTGNHKRGVRTTENHRETGATERSKTVPSSISGLREREAKTPLQGKPESHRHRMAITATG